MLSNRSHFGPRASSVPRHGEHSHLREICACTVDGVCCNNPAMPFASLAVASWVTSYLIVGIMVDSPASKMRSLAEEGKAQTEVCLSHPIALAKRIAGRDDFITIHMGLPRQGSPGSAVVSISGSPTVH